MPQTAFCEGQMLLTMLFSVCAFAKTSTVAAIGSRSYASLEAAVKKVKTVKNFTINLNGKTISFKNNKSCLYIKKGTVTLTNGKIKQSAKNRKNRKSKFYFTKVLFCGRIGNRK